MNGYDDPLYHPDRVGLTVPRYGRRTMKLRPAVTCFVGSVVLLGCSLNPGFTTRETVPSVEQRIDKALPLGSTRQEVEAWLTQQGIEHSFSDTPIMHASAENISHTKSTGIVQGILRDTDRSLLVRGSIQLVFVLDKDGKLKERFVNWVGTGL